jgi:signal transduction histidine kinase
VVTDFGDLPAVACHVGELNQVFLNIIINGAHAIEEALRGTGARGTLSIRTRVDGSSVVVAISDTGTGIPADVQEHIFDPFFTTKAVGKGTGQGLAIARSVVVEKHRGELNFETTPGAGTTFFIRLPIDESRDACTSPETLFADNR